MSKFSEKHPKLAAAFNGAVKDAFSLPHLAGNAVGFGLVSGIYGAFGVASVATLLPICAAGFAGVTVAQGVMGARRSLKEYKKNNPPKPQ